MTCKNISGGEEAVENSIRSMTGTVPVTAMVTNSFMLVGRLCWLHMGNRTRMRGQLGTDSVWYIQYMQYLSTCHVTVSPADDAGEETSKRFQLDDVIGSPSTATRHGVHVE